MERSNSNHGGIQGSGESTEDVQLGSLERPKGDESGIDWQFESSKELERPKGGEDVSVRQRECEGGIEGQLVVSEKSNGAGGGIEGHLWSSKNLERRRGGGGGIGEISESSSERQVGGDGEIGGELGRMEGGQGIGGEDREEGLMRWVSALDLQVVGGCRVDERLKPLLKFNGFSGVAEDRLLAQLSQHFEVSEVGMLARCLCMPLVSIRVGKVNKHGNLLCPIATRGHLNLNLLPSSNMQISFTDDDGFTERLALVCNDFSSCDVIIEEITADASGRCFLLKIPNSQSLYYWCSEKSRQLGQELLAKMKDLLQRKPSLSDITGIPQSRLDAFVIHLRSYILGCTNSTAILTSSAIDSNNYSSENEIDCQPSCMDSDFSYASVTSQIGKEHYSCHESLRPRLDFLKKQMPHLENGAMEKLKQHEDGHLSSVPIAPDFVSLSLTSRSGAISTGAQDDLHRHDIPASPLFLFNPFSDNLSSSQLSIPSFEFSPQYCWCPPGPSPHQSLAASRQPVGSSELLPLPASLSALLSDAGTAISSLPSKLPIDFSELRALTLPTFHPDPIIPISLSASSITLPSSQQFPTFIPFMSDPIVHIPVIDVCSSGQGYLVSGGPAISSIVSPLLPLHVNSLVPKTESAAEKSARETIEMLIASAPPLKPNLGNALLPNLLDNAKKLSSANVSKFDTITVASWSSSFCGGFNTDALRSGNGRSKPEECNGQDDPDDEIAPEHAND